MTLRPALRALLQPCRPAVVCRHLGRIALVLAVLVAVPTLFAYASGDSTLAQRLLLAALVPSLALAACALIPARNGPLQANEALVVAALAFILSAGLMTFPLMAAGLPLVDAWFESVSGVTTTGLSVVSDPEEKSDAFLFTRAWMQWFGGLGIVVLSLALAAGRPADMRRLADAAGDEANYSFRVDGERAVPIADLELPAAARVVCVYRSGGELLFAEPDTRLNSGDEVVVLARAEALKALRERFG